MLIGGFSSCYTDETLSERGQRLVEKAGGEQIDVEQVEGRLLQFLSETETPQGILAVLQLTQLPIPNLPNFILIPDQIRDPGNLGTLLRTAAAAGVQAVCCLPKRQMPSRQKSSASGMGAHFRLPIHAMTWEEIGQITKSANLTNLSRRHGWTILLGNGSCVSRWH